MRVSVRRDGPIDILELIGDVVEGESTLTYHRSFRELVRSGRTRFIIDMRRVGLMDSAGLGETIACHKRARERGGVIKLVVSGKPKELFLLTCLDRIIEMYDGLEEALASFIPH